MQRPSRALVIASWCARAALLATAGLLVMDGGLTAMTLRGIRLRTPQRVDDLGELFAARHGLSNALFVALFMASVAFVAWLALAVSRASTPSSSSDRAATETTTKTTTTRGTSGRPSTASSRLQNDLRRGPTWAILCWVIPLVNLVAPYRIVRALYLRASPNPGPQEPGAAPTMVFVWWACWLAGLSLSFASEAARHGGSARLSQGLGLQLASAPTLAISAVLAAGIVSRVTRGRDGMK